MTLTELIADLHRRGCYCKGDAIEEVRAEFNLSYAAAYYHVNKLKWPTKTKRSR